MPSSSWSKKVARAAGTGGGRTRGGRLPWSYYGAILLVLVLGVTGTFFSKERRNNQLNNSTQNAAAAAPAVGTTWNEAIAFYTCGTFAPNVPKPKSNPYGLTTQGDGIMHIDPTSKAAAGKNATLGKWASANGVTLSATELQLPKGKRYTTGQSCDGGKSQVYVKQFAYPGDPTGVLVKGNPANVHLQDQLELVVAFVPPSKSAKIPGPPATVVAKLKSLAASSSTSTTVAPTTTVAPATTVAPTTTAPAGATTTAPAAATTTAPAAPPTTAPATPATTTAP